MPSPPKISLIFPLEDPRGDRSERVRSWALDQTLPRTDFEIVAVCDGSDPAGEKLVEEMLEPTDQLVRISEKSDLWSTHGLMRLYEMGIRSARAEILVLTEHHCIGDADCLQEVLRFYESSDAAGGCFNVKNACCSTVARLDWEMHEEALGEFLAPGHWNKVMFRGCTLRRQIAHEVLDIFRFGLFAEPALGIRLHQLGHELAYIDRARLTHIDDNTIGFMLELVHDYAEGEIAFLNENAIDTWEPYLGVIPEWSDRLSNRLANRIRSFKIAYANAIATLRQPGNVRSWIEVRFAIRHLLDSLRRLLTPAAYAALEARCMMNLARAQFALTLKNGGRLVRAHRMLREQRVRLTRLRSIAKSRTSTRTSSGIESPVALDRCDSDQLTGFHNVEQWQGKAFRWTRSLATVRLKIPITECQVSVALLPIRCTLQDCPASFYMNGHRLQIESQDETSGTLILVVPEKALSNRSSQQFTILCRPIGFGNPSDDPRELGVPVAAIRVLPISQQCRPTIQQASSSRPTHVHEAA